MSGGAAGASTIAAALETIVCTRSASRAAVKASGSCSDWPTMAAPGTHAARAEMASLSTSAGIQRTRKGCGPELVFWRDRAGPTRRT